MFSRPVVAKRGAKEEAEKPFWISYADLMTALMVLFLVAMSVAMLAVTNSAKDIEQKNDKLKQTIAENDQEKATLQQAKDALAQTNEELEQNKNQLAQNNETLQQTTDELRKLQKTPAEIEIEKQKAEREAEISKLLDEVSAVEETYGIKVHEKNTIDFGDKAHFEKKQYILDPSQMRFIRGFVPKLLTIARDDLGRKWLKQVVVEGFASPEGGYLYNLNLSMQRSQRVLCVLLAQPYPDENAMSPSELEQIRNLFLVGGFSFNAAKLDLVTGSYDESRRVELRLEFVALGETRPSTEASHRKLAQFEQCALDQ